MVGIRYTKHLELTFGGTEVHCDLTSAILSDEPEGAETLVTYCSSEDVPGVPKYTLSVEGFQSWSEADDALSLLHDAYVAEETIDCVLTVGSRTRTFEARPLNDTPFGAEAGSAFTGSVDLSVLGKPVDGTVPAPTP